MNVRAKGFRRDASKTKGRALDMTARGEIEALLGDAPIQRDLLIEYLHLIQNRYGRLSAGHLNALADIMRISEAEVYEVATFYHHFDVVREDEDDPAPLTVRVCESLSCMMAGAEDLIATLKAETNPRSVRIQRVPCIGRCAEAPAAQVAKRAVGHATVSTISQASQGSKEALIPNYVGLHTYRAEGGYQLLKAVRQGAPGTDELIKTLNDAGLRGLGGAGFPAGRKWSIVRSFEGPRLMTINGDEGEPGTFKDRHYIETDPHRILEGALIAAHAVEAQRIYLYMRDEYPAAIEILSREIAILEAAGVIDTCKIELRRGAGAYICGEESAMLESIEGKRGLPRHRPPYIAEVGLFGRPTLNHNLETLWWIRDIVEKGPAWFADQGIGEAKGLRSYSVSGRVKEPGVKIAPAGISVSQLIDEYCGGMADGHIFKAYLPGGASGGIFPASEAAIPLDFGGRLNELGGFIGSHAVIILSDQDSIKDAALNLMRFFEHESCGQCTPCRSGTEKMVQLLNRDRLDEEAIRDLEFVMRNASICGLGIAAPNPVNHLLTFFREDL